MQPGSVIAFAPEFSFTVAEVFPHENTAEAGSGPNVTSANASTPITASANIIVTRGFREPITGITNLISCQPTMRAPAANSLLGTKIGGIVRDRMLHPLGSRIAAVPLAGVIVP